ncbi:MAG: deoxyguanosine kinase [Candidatus Tyloplasma litorale]|nr:MAG: deoxyguanosine kinase [Mycoplasmatales bacterium]
MKRVAIIGTPGIGKTTILNELKKICGNQLKFNVEEEKYSYLEKAYKDMKKWSFIMQMDFLMLRLRTLHYSYQEKLENINAIIFDRSFIDDYIYAKQAFQKNWISQKNFEEYKSLFNNFVNLSVSENFNYDLIIILTEDEKGDAAKRRIKRNRFIEKQLDHFEEIDEVYASEEIINHCKKFVPKVEVVKNLNNKQKDVALKIISLIQ